MPSSSIHTLVDHQGQFTSSNQTFALVQALVPVEEWKFHCSKTEAIITPQKFVSRVSTSQQIDISCLIGNQLWLGTLVNITQEDSHFALVNLNLVNCPADTVKDKFHSQTLHQHLKFLQQELNQILEMAPAITYKMDYDQSLPPIFVSSCIERLLGYTQYEISDSPFWWQNQIHPDDRDKFLQRLTNLSQQKVGAIERCEYRFKHKNGNYLWLADRARVIIDAMDCSKSYLVGSVMDISDVVELNTRIESLTAVAPGVVYQFQKNKNGNYCFPYASPQMESFFGITPDQVVDDAKPIFNVIHKDDLKRVYASIEQASQNHDEWECEFRVVNSDKVRWVYGHSIPLSQQDGQYVWSGLVIDISDKKTLELKLQKESTTDPLTGLCNRRYFMDYLDASLEDFKVDKLGAVSIVAIDFDHFKQVNDIYGHPIGDKVLKEVSAEIARKIRQTDCLARMGGEEFNIILPNASYDRALKIAESIRADIEKFEIKLPHKSIYITMTLGVASTDQGIFSSSKLLKFSDRALYKGKASGRNCVV